MNSAAVKSFINGEIADVVVYPLKKFYDDRGWLAELFRTDQLDERFRPEMAYISFTKPGVARGPHEHAEQADLFCFIGPSNFRIRLWDDREDSPTYRNFMDIEAGEESPKAVVIPCGIVHGYKNIGEVDGMVLNCPNRLYMGQKKAEAADDIRHEDDPNTEFIME